MTNISKAEAFMDYENRPSGFARYGDGSTKGRRIVEEPFSKGIKLPKIIKKSPKPQASKAGEIAPGVKYMGPGTVGMRGSQSVKKSQLVEVSKRIRNKDAEDDRQRRLGMGTAAAGLGSALLLRRGIGGSIKTTRALRGELTPGSWKRLPKETRTLFTHTDESGKRVPGKGFAHTGRDLAYTAGGTAAGAGAVTLDHYARGRRNRRWE